MRKLLREVNELTQGHTACEGTGQDLNPGLFRDAQFPPSQKGRLKPEPGSSSTPGGRAGLQEDSLVNKQVLS